MSVALLRPDTRIALAQLTCAWAVAALLFVSWWVAQPTAGLSAGWIVSSVVLAMYVLVLPVWLFFFVNRARRPHPGLRLPADTRLAMVVTKAPSEPWPMVRDTLRAMLAQDIGMPYHVWLADEDPDPRVVAWCDERGVGVCTRRDAGPDYHRDTWPRRKRCKEGNLAFFYDTVGYDRYDVVAQLDADHVPDRDYLRRITAPFAKRDVGYVAAPSICDLNAEQSWAARGRLHEEAMLHGVMHAGAGGGYAPSCIGSHYAVRTSAVRSIGGLGPDLAEDFSTTLLLSAAGWDGAFAIDAIAHGRGPDTVADCLTQELQWSRSMTTLLLTIGPGAWRRLDPRRRARLGFCLLWYPLVSAVFVVAHLMPLWALVGGGPLVRVDLWTYLLHMALIEMSLLGAVLVVRSAGALRPHDAPAISWEMILYRLVRWPWNVLGVLTALYVVLTRRTVEWKVTPKGIDAQGRALDLRVLVFPLVVVAVFTVPVLLVPDPSAAGGYFLFSIVGACTYAAVAAALVVLHARENPRAVGMTIGDRRLLSSGPVATATVALVAVLVVLQGPTSVRSAVPEPVVAPVGAGGPAPQHRLGVSVGLLSQNEAQPLRPGMLDEITSFARAAGAEPGVITWFSDWVQPPPRMDRLRAVDALGAVPEITWEPRDHRAPRDQKRFRMERIARGDFDAYANAWARRLAAYGRPVVLRFAHEMNHHAYPWGTAEGTRPGTYVTAWRHLRSVFAKAGATNVRWDWSPTASNLDWRYYPGDDVVDIIGLTGFNGGSDLDWNGWRSPGEMFGRALRQIAERAPGKPVEISEVSSSPNGGNRPAWIERLFVLARRWPQVRTISWFNIDKQAQWRLVPDSPESVAFREGLASWPVRVPRCGTGRPFGGVLHRDPVDCRPAPQGEAAFVAVRAGAR
ncbi:glycosyltransferase family 2 protein [Patulibacter sp.]|uniref:glycosyltransferase family 2 protein n=1 Tax=Patulibacter sp. TaxID=1912859 RepID=UPI0027232745|nr:glycosyltransferase family 2 protein [Patulibacter sp.]MDO9407973.1 glycosyltransferase [Patulibacter sp.]